MEKPEFESWICCGSHALWGLRQTTDLYRISVPHFVKWEQLDYLLPKQKSPSLVNKISRNKGLVFSSPGLPEQIIAMRVAKKKKKKERKFSQVLEAVLNCFSYVWLCATLWTVACQAPLSMGFSKQEYWSRLLCPPQGITPIQGLNLCCLHLQHW